MLKGFVEVRPVEELWVLLYGPLVWAVLVLGAVFLLAAPRLGLEGVAGVGRLSGRGAEATR